MDIRRSGLFSIKKKADVPPMQPQVCHLGAVHFEIFVRYTVDYGCRASGHCRISATVP